MTTSISRASCFRRILKRLSRRLAWRDSSFVTRTYVGSTDFRLNLCSRGTLTSDHQGYDHSYFFISTFGADHVKHAAKALGLI